MSNNLAHGTSVIGIEGAIVKTEIASGFNEQGIDAHFKQVLLACEHLPHWVLYKHIDVSALMTPDAKLRLIAWTNKLSQYGCCGVYYYVESAILFNVLNKAFQNVKLPIQIESSDKNLANFAKIHLKIPSTDL